MKIRSNVKDKRFKIAVLAILISTCFGMTAMIYSLPVAIITVALGGIQGVAIAFVAGDSYRESIYNDTETNSNTNNNSTIYPYDEEEQEEEYEYKYDDKKRMKYD
jgi:hypothetical protein